MIQLQLVSYWLLNMLPQRLVSTLHLFVCFIVMFIIVLHWNIMIMIQSLLLWSVPRSPAYGRSLAWGYLREQKEAKQTEKTSWLGDGIIHILGSASRWLLLDTVKPPQTIECISYHDLGLIRTDRSFSLA